MGTVARQSYGTPARPRLPFLSGLVVLMLAVGVGNVAAMPPPPHVSATVEVTASPATPQTLPLPAAIPPANLQVIGYEALTSPFPADPHPLSMVHHPEGLHPIRSVAVYDAPGGQPLAYLPPTIRGVPVTVPIVQRSAGWVGVLLPSINRAIGWIPPGGWESARLRDHIVVSRTAHRMTWFRDAVAVMSWPVTLGAPATPTPLGRTFILGRSALPDPAYAGVDVFALGSVPENPDALPPGLRGAHIGIHTWRDDRTLGQDASDGCIRLTKTGQQLLLRELAPGTMVVVTD